MQMWVTSIIFAFKMNNSADQAKLSGNPDESSFIPLSEYAKKLELRVKQRYMEKISAIGIDPVLIESKNFEPDCLPPVECTDLLFYLVLETSFYTHFWEWKRLPNGIHNWYT